MTDPLTFRDRLSEAIGALYADAPIIGEPDLLDLDRTERRSAHGA